MCAEVSQRSDNSKPVYHQTLNAQNSMLTKEIHDQGTNKEFLRYSASQIQLFSFWMRRTVWLYIDIESE